MSDDGRGLELPPITITQEPSGKRWYQTHDGLRGPSATTVIKTVFGDPFPDVARRAGQYAADKGTEAHDAIRYLVGGYPGFELDWDSVDVAVRPRVEMFQRWQTKTGWRSILTEASVFSRTWCFGATIDHVGGFSGDRLVILEIKPAVAKTANMQTAAQALALRETFNLQYVPKRYVLHLTDTKARPVPMFDDARDRDKFLNALFCFNTGHEQGLWLPAAAEREDRGFSPDSED